MILHGYLTLDIGKIDIVVIFLTQRSLTASYYSFKVSGDRHFYEFWFIGDLTNNQSLQGDRYYYESWFLGDRTNNLSSKGDRYYC